MTTAARRPEPVTVEDFDRFVEGQADSALFELVEGVVVMMTNPTEVHEQIAANIGAPLKLAMDARGCRTYQGGYPGTALRQSEQHRQDTAGCGRAPWRSGDQELYHRSAGRDRGPLTLDN